MDLGLTYREICKKLNDKNQKHMKTKLLSLAVLFISLTTLGQTQWVVDPYHSSLNFSIKHLGISMVTGKFLEYTGSLETTGEGLEDAKFDFQVNANSINTNVEPRDNHLRSADFFEVEKYPYITFKSTKSVQKGKKNHYCLSGNLTIKDVTKNITVDLYYGGSAKTDDGEKLGMWAEITINRFDYNINYDPTAMGIAKDVNILVFLEFSKK